MNKIFTQFLQIRGIEDDFLNPKYEDLENPFTLPDMEAAVKRIKRAIKKQEKILIYGDYDADGVTSSTLMYQALKLAGLENIEIMLPGRFIDGYGMSPRLVEKAKTQQINLIITVDCGSSNHEIIEELNTLGIDTIVTDHHECPSELPNAVAVINPKRHDFNPDSRHAKTLRDLAGVGVAFKLAQALTKSGFIPDGQEKWLLDLVLIGTICDSMTLTLENRILTFYGLKVLTKTRRKGLIELMHLLRIKTLNSETIGFQIGPRLNAAGRLDTADLSLNLLLSNTSSEAANLSAKLELLNEKRHTEQCFAIKELKDLGLADETDPVIIKVGPYHEGVLGIVAGQLVEEFHKPTFIFAETSKGIYKGSARSFGDFDLSKALENTKDYIINGGGHSGAAGIKLKKSQFEDFKAKIIEYYKNLHLVDQERFFDYKADLSTNSLADFSLEFTESLAKLEPFGPGNEEPIFEIKQARILKVSHMGKNREHLRVDIEDDMGYTLKLVTFFAPEEWFNLEVGAVYNFFIKIVESNFNNIRTVEARLLNVI